MRGERKKIRSLILVGLVITLCVTSIEPVKSNSIDPFFTLVAKCNSGLYAEYLNIVKQHLKQIGINVDVIVLAWPDFVADLIAYHDYDLLYYGFQGGESFGPDISRLYGWKNNPLNIWGYDPSMDWNQSLGSGINEWYIRQGNQIWPPDSEERIQHYWKWQDYLMDKLCPMLPTFARKEYEAHWSNLVGYNYSVGLHQSWGKMNWDGIHLGQANNSEFVISDLPWTDLNPLFQEYPQDRQISDKLMDSLIWYDPDLRTWPHLAKNYTHINGTHVRIEIRDGIKWATDPEGNFTNEYLNVDDVYFTFYCWKYVSLDQNLFDWLKEMVIVDQYTIDLFIDGNNSTPENELYAGYLPFLTLNILPEHFLNQTQLPDGITPDITHQSWNIFATQAFGTGLFELKEHDEGNETILSLRPESWWLNESLTIDPNLNWVERFGNFSGGLNQLRIRILTGSLTRLAQFEFGLLDIVDISWNPEKRLLFESDSNIEVQNDTINQLGFIAYNMREERKHIGSREPCPLESSTTIGLAIRKAISYAVNRVVINEEINDGEYSILHTPLTAKMGIWINPSIKKYEYDYLLAKDYMYIAGFDIDYTPTTGFSSYASLIASITIYLVTIFIMQKRRRNRS